MKTAEDTMLRLPQHPLCRRCPPSSRSTSLALCSLACALLSITLLPGVYSQSSTDCPDGWYSGYNGYCYFVSTLNQSMAEDSCQSLGADLTSMITVAENKFIDDSSSAATGWRYWFGLMKFNATTGYNGGVYYLNGDAANYYPSLGSTSTDSSSTCNVYYSPTSMDDENCGALRPFACNTPKTPPTTSSGAVPSYWDSYSSDWYFFSTLSASDATLFCQSIYTGATLAGFNSSDWNFVTKNLLDTRYTYWIGLTQLSGSCTDKCYKWLDGSSTLDWSQYLLDSNRLNYVRMYSDAESNQWKLASDSGTANYAFICKMPVPSPGPVIMSDISCILNTGCCWTVMGTSDVACFNYTPVYCPPLRIPYASISTTDTNYTTSVRVTCNRGYAVDPFNRFNNSFITNCTRYGNWSMFSPINGTNTTACLPIQCPFPNVTQANFTGNLTYLSVINMTCNTGYAIGGTDITFLQSQCKADATWTVPSMYCQAINCSSFYIVNGDRDNRNNSYQSIVTVTCRTGFEFNDSSTSIVLSCQANKTWSIPPQNCSILKCPPLNVTYATLSPATAVTYGSIVSATCNAGYVFPDNKRRISKNCTLSKTWDPPSPDSCTPITCTLPAIEFSSQIDDLILQYQGEQVVLCSRGYVINTTTPKSQSTRAICQADATISSWPFSCQPVQCTPLSIDNASLNDTSHEFPDYVGVTCNTGYVTSLTEHTTSAVTHCAENGKWTADVKCQPVYCSSNPPVANSSVCFCNSTFSPENPPDYNNYDSYNGYKYGAQFQYDCKGGRKFIDGLSSHLITCTIFGNWSFTDINCLYGVCDPVPDVPNSQPSTTMALNGTVVVYTCNDGYKFSNGQTTTTISCDGSVWSSIPDRCYPVNCSRLSIDNAVLSTKNVSFPTDVTVTCQDDWTVDYNVSSAVMTCRADATWWPKTVTCLPPSDCHVTWSTSINMVAGGGTLYSGSDDMITELQCILYCANEVANCLAVTVYRYKDGSISCFTLTDPRALQRTFYSPGANFYVIKQCPTTINTRPSIAPTTGPSTPIPFGMTWNNCNATWSNRTGRAAAGATFYSQFNTINNCLGACAYLVRTCVAAQVDVSSTPNKCYMITDASNLFNTFAGNGVNLYVLVPVCGNGQGAGATTAAPARTTMPITSLTTLPTVPTTQTFVEQNKCFRPARLTNSDITMQVDSFGVVAIYQCNQGFEFPGGGFIRSVICINNVWSMVIEDCLAISCGLGNIDKSTYNSVAPSVSNGQTFTGSCPQTLPGQQTKLFENGAKNTQIKCVAKGSDGILTSQPTACNVGRCRSPPIIANGTTSLNVATRTLTITCQSGYHLNDGRSTMTAKCNDDGTWNDYGICSPMFCPAWTLTSRSSISTSDVVYGTALVVSCDTGYMFSDGNNQVTVFCVSTGGLMPQAVWSNTKLTCVPVFCGDIPLPADSSTCSSDAASVQPDRTNGKFAYDTAVQYTCSGRLRFPTGQSTLTSRCGPNGQWTFAQEDLVCIAGVCDPPPVVNFATPSTKKATNGTVVEYTCKQAYQFSTGLTTASTTCNGKDWSPIESACTEIQCPELTFSNVQWTAYNRSYQSTVNITCNIGYQLPGGVKFKVLTCKMDGQWSYSAESICSPIDCAPAPSLSGAVPIFSDKAPTTYGSAPLEYDCLAGKWFARKMLTTTATCMSNGTWSVVTGLGVPSTIPSNWPSCIAVTCLPMTITMIVNTTNTTVGTVGLFQCSDGQTIINNPGVDNVTAVCFSSGDWVPSVSGCQSIRTELQTTKNVQEAAGANAIAGVAVATLSFGGILLVLADLLALKSSISLLTSNIKVLFAGKKF